MKEIFLILMLTANFLFAKEGVMCSFYYDSITRKVNIINEKKNDLSKMALNKLYKDLTFETTECISQCEDSKFDFCNKVAKKIEESN